MIKLILAYIIYAIVFITLVNTMNFWVAIAALLMASVVIGLTFYGG